MSMNEWSRPLTESELNEIANDPNFYSDEESAAEENEFQASDHETNSEASSDGDESHFDNDSDDSNVFYGKDKNFKWQKACKSRSRTRTNNLIIHLPGPKGRAKNIDKNDITAVWKLFLTDNMLETILLHTNVKIRNRYEQFQVPRPSYTAELDMIELNAFLGLLYLSGVMKSNHEDISALFANDGTGRDVFRATMSVTRFLFILSCLRFDDALTRDQRKEHNKLAAIQECWNIFIANCESLYTPGEYLTIDEMLVPFRGRCSFKMYMPKKPAKYGLKIMCLCDARTFYLCNAFVYTGKENTVSIDKVSVPTRDVLKLIPPIQNTNRNVTTDNWFSSVELCNKLREQGLTLLGTMRINKPQLPLEFKPNRRRQVGSTIFGHNNDITIASYVPKKTDRCH